MATTKTEKIMTVDEDVAVITARKKLNELEQKLEQAIHRPLQAEAEDITQRARALLDGKPPKPKVAADEIRVLKEAVSIALANYQQARQAAAQRIIAEIKPLHNKTISELLDASEKFSAALLSQAAFVESCWHSGLYDYLPATWSLKWPIVLGIGKPGTGGRLDELILNLRASSIRL